MDKDYLIMAIITCISILLLLIFVKKTQIRKAFFAFLVAQLFSWPTTLIYVLFDFQQNPIRLFPQATDSNFLFAFIFHPSVFAVYYLHYPKQARLAKRMMYTVVITVVLIVIHLFADLFTNLIYYPKKIVLMSSFVVIFILYTISRKYIDWFFQKALTSMEE